MAGAQNHWAKTVRRCTAWEGPGLQTSKGAGPAFVMLLRKQHRQNRVVVIMEDRTHPNSEINQILRTTNEELKRAHEIVFDLLKKLQDTRARLHILAEDNLRLKKRIAELMREANK